jgi:hypothetical protein
MNQLIEAWLLWFAGRLGDTYILWGIQLLWWGRIGKLLQLLAILTAVIEVVGAERLKEFGNRLHGTFSLQKLLTLVNEANTFTWFWIRSMTSNLSAEENARNVSSRMGFFHFLLLVFTLFLFGYLLWSQFFSLLWQDVTGLLRFAVLVLYVFAILFAFGIFAWISGYITLIVVLLFYFLGLLIDSIIIEPIAWAISRPKLEILIKVVAIIAAIIGFHFDFLAS